MIRFSLAGVLAAAWLTAGCGFENTSRLLVPTSPGGVNAGSGTTPPSGSGTTGSGGATTTPPPSSSTGSPAAAFAGAWGMSSFAGLPIGNCADLTWTIAAQSATSVAGTLTATCTGGTTVSANLTGEAVSTSVMNLTAAGTLTAMGLPCAFSLSGTGTRQSDDSMNIAYQGTYCFGSVNGAESLRKFPTLP